MKKIIPIFAPQLIRFGIVGITAMLIHLAVVITLVHFSFPPLVANILGFLIAFQASYIGHSKWTFDVQASNDDKQKFRFFSVAVLGFCINEFSYFVLLNIFKMDYRTALVIVLLSVAALTFVLSKLWAFRA